MLVFVRDSKKNTGFILSLYNNQTLDQPTFVFTFSGLTHTGRVRTRNEDSYTCLPEHNLWVVADGMGGHEAGEFASQTITQQAQKFTQQPSLEASIMLLEENLLHSNQLIREKASKLGKQTTIGSTVTCLHTWKNLAFVLWAGDSRLYRFRDNALQRLTEDHSYVEELVRMGKLKAEEAEQHPASNVVLNAVGIENQLIVDMEYYEIEDQDLFILCSDGLYKDLSTDRIAEILNNTELSMDELNNQLIETALTAGGSDNCTVVLVRAVLEEKNV
jgi:serine/threonine protein phosphatase PrpC